MFTFVPYLIRRHCSIRIRCFQIKSVIFLLCLNICLKFSSIAAGPTSQQQQELLLLEALSKRQPSYYGTSNSIMDILGRSMYLKNHVLWVYKNLNYIGKQSHSGGMHACAVCTLHMLLLRAHNTQYSNAYKMRRTICFMEYQCIIIIVDCVWNYIKIKEQMRHENEFVTENAKEKKRKEMRNWYNLSTTNCYTEMSQSRVRDSEQMLLSYYNFCVVPSLWLWNDLFLQSFQSHLFGYSLPNANDQITVSTLLCNTSRSSSCFTACESFDFDSMSSLVAYQTISSKKNPSFLFHINSDQCRVQCTRNNHLICFIFSTCSDPTNMQIQGTSFWVRS